MRNRPDSQDDNDDGPVRLSRAEIETLCILYAVDTGCRLDDLAGRLGLPRKLATIVAQALQPLVESGDLTVRGDAVELTNEGRQRLRVRLSALGLQGVPLAVDAAPTSLDDG